MNHHRISVCQVEKEVLAAPTCVGEGFAEESCTHDARPRAPHAALTTDVDVRDTSTDDCVVKRSPDGFNFG